jgi:hypothetical protein
MKVSKWAARLPSLMSGLVKGFFAALARRMLAYCQIL